MEANFESYRQARASIFSPRLRQYGHPEYKLYARKVSFIPLCDPLKHFQMIIKKNLHTPVGGYFRVTQLSELTLQDNFKDRTMNNHNSLALFQRTNHCLFSITNILKLKLRKSKTYLFTLNKSQRPISFFIKRGEQCKRRA